MKVFSRIYIPIVFLLLYLPIIIVILFSFNDAGTMSHFEGFSFKWYVELFEDKTALSALWNSLDLAITSSLPLPVSQ